MKKLVVIPSDPIKAYEQKGTSSWLKDYFNPNQNFDEVYVLSPKESLAREVYGLKIVPIASDQQFRKELKKIAPLCVRAYGGYWATDYANYNRVPNIPVVSSIHDTNPNLMYEGLRFSDEYFVMSNVIANVLEDKYSINNIKLLGNRVDTSIFKKIDAQDNPLESCYQGKKIILHVGRKSHEKNIETVINALVYLPEDHIAIFIGKGDVLSYQVLAEEQNVQERIFFIEKVENEELVYWYNVADVLCVPSRWEGFGLVFVEAASCFTKIVTSNIAPMNEYLLNDGVMNILVDKNEDPETIASAIIKILSGNDLNANTRGLIEKRFDKKVVSNREVSLYNNIGYNPNYNTLAYKKWRFKYRIARDVIPRFKKIIKLPKRLWKKIDSYR